jgi:ribosomal protein L11 methylase PrmA
MSKLSHIESSFRDPSGFIFKKDNILYRQINKSYKNDYDFLINSGLFSKLVEKKYLINHKEVKLKSGDQLAYKIIQPEFIPFVSYPYEWSFSQLKDAALLTLKIQKTALKFGMSLKDATAYNIQFVKSHPILIDTLSFEKYEIGKPWIAYKQFCQHFLAPLALMSFKDLNFGKLSSLWIDGIPLDLTAKNLPFRAKLSPGILFNIFMHASSQSKHAGDTISENKNPKPLLNKNQLLAIIENLESTVQSLKIPRQKTIWEDYYDNTNYTKIAYKNKIEIISQWLKKIKPTSVWDMGGNDGTFGRLASAQKISTLVSDFDPLAIEKAYLKSKEIKDEYMLPLIIDLINPSPAIGWENQERMSFLDRANFDLTLCLALVHHLALTNNLPLSYISKMLFNHTKKLIIEFIPKTDSNVKLLLSRRTDIFENYNQESFEKEFQNYFRIIERKKIKGSERILYLMERK